MAFFKKRTIVAGAGDATQATDSIAALSSALSQGAAQQEIAAKRLAGLSDAITRLDASRREAERLGGEVARLSRTLRETETKFEAKSAWASEQSAKYTAIKSERDELRRQLDAARTDMAKAQEAKASLLADMSGLQSELDASRKRAKIDAERAELSELARAKLAEQDAKRASVMKAQAHKITEMTRASEDLTARLADKTSLSEDALSSLRELRSEHSGTKEKLIEALNALQTAEYQLSRQDTAHGEAIGRRADEATALRRQVEQLSAELRIKDGMGEHYDKDLSEMRGTLQVARERLDAADARLRESAETEARQAQALAQSKIDYDALSEKFSDALRDIEALRKVNLMQRKTLERYAEIGGAASPKSHVSPEPVRPVRVVGKRA